MVSFFTLSQMAKQGSKDFKFHKNCNNDNKFGGTEKEKRKSTES
jgi:hypothetical protein